MERKWAGTLPAIGIILSVAASSGIVEAQTDIPPEVLAYADMVLYNGKVLTADATFSVAQAVAIRDGKILAVGTSQRILAMAGPNSRRIDLGGESVVPGFIDTHDHLADYALQYMFLEEHGVKYEGELVNGLLVWTNREMAVRDIQKFVKAVPPGELVQLPLRHSEELATWQLTREELDRLAPDHPLILRGVSLQPLAVNTATLRWAGIAEDTKGVPARNATFIGGAAATALDDRLRWTIPLAKMEEWHRKAMMRANSWGLTMVKTRIRPESFTALREILMEGRMTVRWRLAFPGPLDIPRTGNLTDIGNDLLRIAGASGGALPGDPTAADMWLTNPPLKESSSQEWLARWPQARKEMIEAWRHGWNVPNTHVKGDGAAAEFLTAIENARQSPIVPTAFQRFTIDHNPLVRLEDMKRMKDIGVVPSVMPRELFSTFYANVNIEALGTERLSRFVALRSYLQAGILPSIEADSGHPHDGRPLWKIEKIVTRKDDEGRVWALDQKVSRQEALWMNTSWAARATGDEKILGSLEPQKLADLVVLGGDYTTVPEEQISKLPVRMTILDGRIVYEAKP